MLVNFAVGIFGVIIFLFIFWKRLKEDYASEIIFQSAFYILIGAMVGYLLSFRFAPNWFFWIGLGGGMSGLGIAILKLRIKFYESLEAFIIAALPFLALIFLMDSVAKSSLSSFLAFLAILILVFLSYWTDTHYKTFTWYKSGKVGFAGLTTAALVFAARAAIAILGITMISFVGKYEAIISGVLAFISFLLLFNLGRQE